MNTDSGSWLIRDEKRTRQARGLGPARCRSSREGRRLLESAASSAPGHDPPRRVNCACPSNLPPALKSCSPAAFWRTFFSDMDRSFLFGDVMVFGIAFNFWKLIGWSGSLIFGLRFLIQWLASERARKSVIPVGFWECSALGSLLLLAYFRGLPARLGRRFAKPLALANLSAVSLLPLLAPQRGSSRGRAAFGRINRNDEARMSNDETGAACRVRSAPLGM